MKHWSLLLITILLSCILSACSSRSEGGKVGPDAPPDAVPSLPGTYAVNGFDPLGTEYSGLLTIFPGETAGQFKLQWIVTGSIQEGTGILDGNTLVVEWHSLESFMKGVQGKARYTVTVNGELYGTRTVEGHAEEGTETAYPNK